MAHSRRHRTLGNNSNNGLQEVTKASHDAQRPAMFLWC
jgi:hypothetical protein